MTDTATPRPRLWRSARGRVLIGAGLAIAVGAVAAVFVVHANATPAAQPVTVTVPVALSDAKAPAGVKIGIVLTLGQSTVEGSEWANAAQGAKVAQYRLGLGGSQVDLVIEDDHGTTDGGTTAIANLVKKKVSGIVIASSGAHLDPALRAASAAGIPTILPYAPLPDSAPPGVWSLESSSTQTIAAMNQALDGFSHPILLDAGVSPAPGLNVSETLHVEGAEVDALAAEAARRTGADTTANGAYAGGEPTPAPTDASAPPADAVVISGQASRMAELVAALQARHVTVPLLLTPAATSPAFAQTLSERNGTVSSALRTFGVNVGDSAALGRDDSARATSAFLQALRQLDGDPNATNLTGDAPFAQVSAWADARAHDAVVTLAHAAAASGSAKPAEVGAAFTDLTLTAANGIVGAPVDFHDAHARQGAVQTLYATGQALGLRAVASDVPALAWFPEPTPSR